MKESPNTLVKMKKGPGRPKKPEAIIKDVKRRTKRLFNPEEKIAIVLEGLSGDESIAAICRREGIAQSVYYSWSKAFMDAGKARLNGDTKREADSGEVAEMRKVKNCDGLLKILYCGEEWLNIKQVLKLLR